METKSCIWCNSPLPKRRRKYCSDECSGEYFVHCVKPLWWSCATQMALERAENKCEDCGTRGPLEVHHIIPLAPFEPRWNSHKNSQDNLVVLCRCCHERVHHGDPAKRTKSGVIPKEQLALFKVAQ